MPRHTLTALPVLLGAVALGPAGADAAPRNLWATVNVCDTAKHPDMMGVRARMPGDGTRGRMYMRFTAQYRSDSGWKRVSGKSTSGWLFAGSARFRYEELGYTFSFEPPATGGSYLMRGKVHLEWRSRRGRVRHRKRLVTEGGHRSRGADPKRFSAARCRIS
jgi:hypothetical protein